MEFPVVAQSTMFLLKSTLQNTITNLASAAARFNKVDLKREYIAKRCIFVFYLQMQFRLRWEGRCQSTSLRFLNLRYEYLKLHAFSLSKLKDC